MKGVIYQSTAGWFRTSQVEARPLLTRVRMSTSLVCGPKLMSASDAGSVSILRKAPCAAAP